VKKLSTDDFKFCLKYLFLFLKNKVTVLVQVAIKVFEPNSVIAIISKSFKIISLALV